MTNPLEILKTQLEKALDDTSLNIDFREGLADAMYACSLGEAALNVLVFNWTKQQLPEDLSEEDKQYQQGVQFVEEKWHAITGMF